MGGVSELSYPILYEAAETDFRTMGISVLVDAVSLLVTEERNGRFELTMEYPVDSEQFKELRNDRIIEADASPELLDQRFKIIRITKPVRGLVTIYAEHSSYLSRDLALKPSVNYSGSAQIALNTWSNNIVDEHPFEVYSDIVLDKSGTWTIDKVENARKALGGVAGSILQSYGGEYQFDNYAIRLYKNRGVDNGALIAYGKNLTDLTQEEEIDRTYTSVYPYSTLTDDDGNSTVITLPEYFIDSENVVNFARRKILVVNFTDEEITDVDTLRNRTISYISQNGIGLPKVNLKVSFIDLSKTLDHKNMAAIEKIGLCDWVTIYFEKYDIYKKSKVIKTVYNPLIEQYDSIEIGETRASLTQTIESNIANQIKPVRDQLAIVQLQANGKNKTYTQTAEPNNYEDYLVGDSWVRPIGENDRELYHWNGTNWQFLLSTLKTREAEQAITEQKAALEEVKTTADYSYDQLQQTIANSGFTDLDTAFANVQTLSEQAGSNADEAMQKAIDNASLIGGLDDSISSMSVEIDDINNSLTLKANTTEIDRIDGTITDINNELTTQAGILSSKISQTQLDGAIDGIQIGGRNLIKESDPIYAWTGEHNVTADTGAFVYGTPPHYPAMYQIEVRAIDDSVVGAEFGWQQSGAIQGKPVVISKEWGKATAFIEERVNIGLRVRGGLGRIELRHIKVEKGNKATDWTPAPEDNIELISSIQTEWKQTFEEFETSVTGSNGRLTLAEQFLDGFRNTAFDPETGQLSLTEQTINGLQETVSDPVNGLETRVTTIADGFQVLSNDVDGLEAQLSVTNENVLARVEKGDVYSQLLIDSRNILFDANDRIMLSANKVVIDASEGTFISGAVIENASIDSAKISHIDASQVDVININVDSLVGNTSEFIRTTWNTAAGGGTYINGDGIETEQTTELATHYMRISGGQIYTKSNFPGDITPYTETLIGQGEIDISNTVSGTSVGINGESLNFTFGSYEGRMRFNGTNFVLDNNLGLFGNHINSVNWLRLIGDEDFDMTIHKHPTSNGGAIVDSQTVSIGIGIRNGFDTIAQFYGQIDFRRKLDMRSNAISNVYSLGLSDSTTYLMSISTGGALLDGRMITLGTGTPSSFNTHAEFHGQIHFYRNLYMNGKNVVDTSDERKKELITPTKQNSLEMIKALEYKNFYWKDKTISPNKQFGLIAQEVDPTLVHYNEQKDEYGIKQNSLIHAIGHGLQQLALDHENAVSLASKAYLKAESNEERIESLEAELKLLKGA